ncbi:hypothetical protein PCE1_002337 [Barthelona sp. PCE]
MKRSSVRFLITSFFISNLFHFIKMSFTAQSLIVKEGVITELENNVAEILFELKESSDFADITKIRICAAERHETEAGTAVVITVPYICHTFLRVFQVDLTDVLSKKLNETVFFVVKRSILAPESKTTKKASQKRPRSRTLTAVHTAILEDLIFPEEVTARRVRYSMTKGAERVEKIAISCNRLTHDYYPVLSRVYENITGRKTVFSNKL